MTLEDKLEKGEPARLFPTLDSSRKEGRAISILLFNLGAIYELGKSLLGTIDISIGKNAKLSAYTEITFKQPKECADQPDGLIIVRTGRRTWSALIEAKIGKNRIDPAQIEKYLKLARQNDIDAVISVSNEFAVVPEHPPYSISGRLTQSVNLFHWSWKNILTHSKILIDNEDVEDKDQELILREFIRFLKHQSTGIMGIDDMGSRWTPLIGKLVSGAHLSKSDGDVEEVAARWVQESKDLELIISRRTSTHISIKRNREQKKDSRLFQIATCEKLAGEGVLYTEYRIPDAAGNLSLQVNLRRRTLYVWMGVKAPEDKKYSKSCVTWLLRQLKGCSEDNLFVEANWPGNRANTQKPYSEVLDDPSVLKLEDSRILPKSFRIMQICNETRKFRGTKTFVSLLERTVPDFYENVGQKLMSWQAPAPKIKNEEDIQEGIVE